MEIKTTEQIKKDNWYDTNQMMNPDRFVEWVRVDDFNNWIEYVQKIYYENWINGNILSPHEFNNKIELSQSSPNGEQSKDKASLLGRDILNKED